MPVSPRLWGNGLWNNFTSRKKYTIECGKCKHVWDEKVPFVTNLASVICPCCRTRNTWKHSDFNAAWEQQLAQIKKQEEQEKAKKKKDEWWWPFN